jgi:hypothetical protein
LLRSSFAPDDVQQERVRRAIGHDFGGAIWFRKEGMRLRVANGGGCERFSVG